MDVAALLLTGGSSRRMGRDKAAIIGPDGVSLAVRTGRLLAAVATFAVEVGPGRSDLQVVPDDHPGEGPLAAVASGAAALARAGWSGPVVVMATDLPRLDAGLVSWLAAHPAPVSVVTVIDGRPQWLCARYDAATMAAASRLVATGQRRMDALTRDRPIHLAGIDEWAPSAESLLAPVDADTPAELAALLHQPASR